MEDEASFAVLYWFILFNIDEKANRWITFNLELTKPIDKLIRFVKRRRMGSIP